MAETMPTAVLFQSLAAIPPMMAAPMVLAMVLSTRMEARGRSMSVLYFLSRAALLLPSSSRIERYDMGVDISVASSTEHRNDTRIVAIMVRIKAVMLLC